MHFYMQCDMMSFLTYFVFSIFLAMYGTGLVSKPGVSYKYKAII